MKTWIGMTAAAAGAALVAAFGSFYLGLKTQSAADRVLTPAGQVALSGASPERVLRFAGSWDPDQTGAAPGQVETVSYVCEERRSACVAATAGLDRHRLVLRTDQAERTAWGKDRLVITLQGEVAGDCRSVVIVVDLASREITRFARDKTDRPARCDQGDLAAPALHKPSQARLITRSGG